MRNVFDVSGENFRASVVRAVKLFEPIFNHSNESGGIDCTSDYCWLLAPLDDLSEHFRKHSKFAQFKTRRHITQPRFNVNKK